MPLLDCAALLKESKASKAKVLAEAFVKHAIPMIDVAGLQEAFIQKIKTSSKPEVPIFAYKTTEITVDGNEPAEDSFSGQTVASMAYEFCDKLPCGTPIGKAISGFAACELLGMVLGPNIYIKTRFLSSDQDHPQWVGYTNDIVASFQEKPVKRSATGLAWWPEAFLNELMPQKDVVPGTLANPIGPPPPLERVGATAGDEPTKPPSVWNTTDCGECHGEDFSLEKGYVFSEAWYTSTSRLKYYVRPEFVTENLEQLEQMVAEEHAARSSAKVDSYLDERPDMKCTYCGEMYSVCGGDHGDDMRYEQQFYDRSGY